MSVSPPIIIYKKDESGNILEPVEKVEIDIDPKFTNSIIERLTNRAGLY